MVCLPILYACLLSVILYFFSFLISPLPYKSGLRTILYLRMRILHKDGAGYLLFWIGGSKNENRMGTFIEYEHIMMMTS